MLNQKLTNEIADPWNTILSEVKLEFIPSQYVAMAKIVFENGKTWEIDLTTKSYQSIEHIIREIKEEYEEAIVKMDFKINMEKVRNDVSDETRRLFAQW